ncbi:MAG: flagellin [Geminicoccaceae bacterium]
MLTTASNASANTAIRYLKSNAAEASSSLAKLSSGSRIVKSSDDAASLAVGTKIKADVTALKMAQTNSSHAQSLLQVADGGMARIGDILQRMKALATQSQSGSVTDAERSFINQEFSELSTQIDKTASETRFNGQNLLDGTVGKQISNVGSGLAGAGISVDLSGPVANGTLTLAYDGTDTFTLTDGNGDDHTVQIAVPSSPVFEGVIDFASAGVKISLQNFDHSTALSANNTFTVAGSNSLTFQTGTDASDTITFNINNVSTGGLGLSGQSVSTSANAVNAGNALDSAISALNTARAGNGAMTSRFEFVSANLATQVENLDAARSTLMDVDVADEMTKFSSANVLQQAATAMLAQANQMPQNLLRLMQ